VAIAEDATTPAVATASNNTTGIITSASFSPPANSLLVVIVNVGYFTAASGTAAVTVSDSAGGTWTGGPFLGDSAADNSGIWFQYLSSAPGSITVTATNSNHPAAGYQLAVRVLTGAAAGQGTGAGAGSATHATTPASTTATSSITTTTAGSWVYLGACGNAGSSFTAAAATTLIGSFTDSTDAEVLGAGRATAATGTPGATTLGFTAAAAVKTSWAALEILPVTGHAGTAALSGSGTLSGAGVFAGAAALSGSGTLSGTPTHLTSHGHGAAALDGNGTLNGAPTGTFIQAAALSGIGTLAATWTGTLVQPPATLTGTGTLQLSGVKLGFTAGLSGNGTLSVLQATGGLVFASPGAAVPYAYPLSSQVMVAPPGWKYTISGGTTAYFVVTTAQSDSINPGDVFASSAGLGGPFTVTSLSVPFAGFVNVSYTPTASSAMSAGDVTETSARWTPLGSLGVVTALTYSFTCPGGADQMTATVMVPAAYRTQLFNPGWQVRITRGGHQVWSGKLDEPQPTPSGWTLTASGAGTRGQDYLAIYTDTWPHSQPDQSINNAIARGLPWQNPGVGTPSGAWYGQQVDSGAQTISALLTLICTRGGLTWMVSSQPGGTPGDDLTVFPLPTVPNRLLISTSPVPRTLGGDINTIYLRYQASADDTSGSGAAAAFAVTSVQNAASVAAHGVMEVLVDLADVGTMSAGAAQAVGNQVLSIYQRASFSGQFQARYGQLCTVGGVPIDPGTDQAGSMVKLILTDFGYGGEVTPQFPVTFIVGAYEWNDLDQTATISPYQRVDASLTGLLSLANTELTPITAGG
jgi:hypothetical protein